MQITDILNLLDDFVIISPTEDLCRKQLDLFLVLCIYLGIPMAPEKTVGPSQIISFASTELDSILTETRLPQEKLDKCQVLTSVINKQSCQDKDLMFFVRVFLSQCSLQSKAYSGFTRQIS